MALRLPRAGAAAAVAGGRRIARHVGDRGAARGALRLLAMATAGWMNTVVGTLAALTGPLAYLAWRERLRAPARRRPGT